MLFYYCSHICLYHIYIYAKFGGINIEKYYILLRHREVHGPPFLSITFFFFKFLFERECEQAGESRERQREREREREAQAGYLLSP